MTLSEFKAWFEGFTESIDDAPTVKQWARIKKRVGEIDGRAVTERVYVDRYWPPYRPYPYTWTIGSPTYSNAASVGQISGPSYSSAGDAAVSSTFDSAVAMKALGAAEATLQS
jgi:hypothetical protein